MSGRIAKLRKGEAPSLLDASKGNEVIEWVNAFLSCPQVKVSEGKIIITPGIKVYVTGSTNGLPYSGIALFYKDTTPITTS